MTSGRARTLAFGFLVCSLENLFFQYKEIISTSKLPFQNPLVMEYYNVLVRERSGSVVECLTRDRRAAGSSLTGVTALWSLSKTHLS